MKGQATPSHKRQKNIPTLGKTNKGETPQGNKRPHKQLPFKKK